MNFSPIRRLNAARQIATSIRDAILGGDYTAGEGLPSERKLAAAFDVNRKTVREALNHLEAWGLIRIKHGGPTTVQSVLSSAGLHLLPFLIAPRGEPDPKLIADLLQMRVMILSWAARWAAEARPDDISGLEAILERMSVEEADLQALDFDFFEQLAHLSDNQILVMLTALVRDVYFANRDVFAPLYAPDTFSPRFHQRAVDAIKARMPEAAAMAMREYATHAAMAGLRLGERS